MLPSLPYLQFLRAGRWAEHILTQSGINLAGAEGFEPPSSVLETDSLAVELTPLKQFSVVSSQFSVCASAGIAIKLNRLVSKLRTENCRYFVSLCGWCLRQRLQNFLNSDRKSTRLNSSHLGI